MKLTRCQVSAPVRTILDIRFEEPGETSLTELRAGDWTRIAYSTPEYGSSCTAMKWKSESDSRNCQAVMASPAEPGGLPLTLGCRRVTFFVSAT